MATNNQLIARALRMLTVLDHQESMTSVQSTNGLTVLNAMLARWEEDGIALGWSAQTSGSATAPIPASADTAVAANLAVEFGTEFGIAVPAAVGQMAVRGMAALERDSLKNTIVPTDMSHLPNGSGGRYDINSDS
jgi:P22 tail accessory factor.